MTRPLLIAVSIALALSAAACKRDESRAERENMAPGANTATTVPPSSPVDTAGAHSSSAASSTATGDASSAGAGGTSGMGAAGATSGPETAAKGADSTTGMGTNPQVETAAQPYGSQSSVPPTGAPSAGAGSPAR